MPAPSLNLLVAAERALALLYEEGRDYNDPHVRMIRDAVDEENTREGPYPSASALSALSSMCDLAADLCVHAPDRFSMSRARDLVATARGTLARELRRVENPEHEVDKLRRIIETHELCHDQHGHVGPVEFATSCAHEQRKLFGCAPHADALDEARKRIAELEQRLRDAEGLSWSNKEIEALTVLANEIDMRPSGRWLPGGLQSCLRQIVKERNELREALREMLGETAK